jgi:alkylation response protein AidB-like acyl-CoA dehydrogenase
VHRCASEYGGGGVRDFRYNTIVTEELSRVGASGVGFPLHNDVIVPYLLDHATDEQKARWLPGMASGEVITAIAMTEPGHRLRPGVGDHHRHRAGGRRTC